MATTAAELRQYYRDWFAVPLALATSSVVDAVASINDHPLATDLIGCDHFFTAKEARRAGRFYIYAECQHVWSYFVLRGTETKPNPPVYLDSSLDLVVDHGIPASQIELGDYALVCRRFRDFLWQALAHQVLARIESSESLATAVCGRTWNGPKIALNQSFEMRADLPGSGNCFTSESVICGPAYGAAFRDADACNDFTRGYSKSVTKTWDITTHSTRAADHAVRRIQYRKQQCVKAHRRSQ